MNNRQDHRGEIVIDAKLLYDHLSTGDADYHSAETMALVQYDICNNTRDTIKVTVVSEIKGYSSEQPNTLTLAPGQHRVCRHLPVINRDMISRLDRITNVSVLTSFSYQHAGKQSNPEPTGYSITLMPYNTMLWAVPDPDSKSGRTFLLEHIIAWIDPGHTLVQEMLGKAYDLLPSPKRWGYNPEDYDPENTRAQVEAIYNALRASKKLRYLPTSKIARLAKGEISQVIKRPEDSLNTGFSNCIDRAVLYASLIEAAGLDPVIVIKQGHAFVGWKPCNSDLWKHLRDDEKYEFLDTTWTQDGECQTNFELAWQEGARLYNEILKSNWLDNDPFSSNGFARLIDVTFWRRKFERNQVKFVPFVIKDIENENPPYAADDGTPGIITPLPQRDNGSTTSQNEHLLAASRYIMEVETALSRTRLLESGNLTENDCKYALDILNLIHPPDLHEERQWADRLGPHWDSINRLKSSIDDLRLRYALADTSHGKSSRKSFSSPAIAWQYRELLRSTKEIAGDLKVVKMPEGTQIESRHEGAGTKHEAVTIEQHKETGAKHGAVTVESHTESAINDTPSPPETSGPIEIFYSNVPKDEPMAERLRNQLVMSKRLGLITDWHTGMIQANQEPDEEIRKHLNSAKIILLFISPDYLNSDYHYSVEVKRAMERSRAEEAIVMPILLSTIDGLSATPFGKLKIFPGNRKPIHEWQNKDKALAEIAGEIRRAVDGLISKAEAG